MTDTPIPGKVTWFEIATTDGEASATFWSGLFGWQTMGDPGVYLMVPPAEEGGLPGGIMPAPKDVGPYATFAVEVPTPADVDAAHDRAVALGATSVVAPTDNPGGVRSAYLRDPDGSLFSIYKMTQAPSGPPAT